MKPKLKRAIHSAISDTFDEQSEQTNPPWDEYVHDELVGQMTAAAVAVFDAAQDAQRFYKKETA